MNVPDAKLITYVTQRIVNYFVKHFYMHLLASHLPDDEDLAKDNNEKLPASVRRILEAKGVTDFSAYETDDD